MSDVIQSNVSTEKESRQVGWTASFEDISTSALPADMCSPVHATGVVF